MTIASASAFPTIEEFLGNRVSSWHWAGSVTGNNTGGGMSIQFPFQSTGQDVARFFVLRDWRFWRDDGLGMRLGFIDYDGDWIDYQLFEDLSGNEVPIAQQVSDNLTIAGAQDNLQKQEALYIPQNIYLGRPLPGEAASLTVTGANTDTIEVASKLICLAFRFKADALMYYHFGILNPLVK